MLKLCFFPVALCPDVTRFHRNGDTNLMADKWCLCLLCSNRKRIESQFSLSVSSSPHPCLSLSRSYTHTHQCTKTHSEIMRIWNTGREKPKSIPSITVSAAQEWDSKNSTSAKTQKVDAFPRKWDIDSWLQCRSIVSWSLFCWSVLFTVSSDITRGNGCVGLFPRTSGCAHTPGCCRSSQACQYL